MPTYAAWDDNRAKDIVESLKAVRGATLPMLHALQEEFGYVDAAAVPLIAETLNLSRAEIHGVVTFYHEFRQAPPGRHVVKLCRAEACQSVGCRDLEAAAMRALGIGYGETTADGAVTLEAVYCLGNCALSPAIMIDGELCGRVSEDGLERLLGGLGRVS
jgi:formate dehydrogenase subunit gamma